MGVNAAKIAGLWQTLSRYPGGQWLFNRLIGFYVPYSGSIGAEVQQLQPGYAKLELKDRRRVRNHLRCIHAIALVNLGEITSGLAMYATIPPKVRGIVVGIEARYLKKARGRLSAESHCQLPEVGDEPVDFHLATEIKDAAGELVAEVKVIWRLEVLA